MKKLLSFIIVSVFFASTFAQLKVQPVDAVETGYLYDLSFQLSGMEQFDGSTFAPAISHNLWNQVYFEISKSKLTKRESPLLTNLHKQAKTMVRENQIPIGLLFYKYNYLNENPETLLNNQGILDISGVELQEREVFAATTFRSETFNGSQLFFSFPNDFFFSNQSESIAELFINFDNDLGWQVLNPGGEIPVNYKSTGTKKIRIKALLKDKRELLSTFTFEVSRLETPAPSATWLVESDLAYNGISTSGDAYVLLSDQNTKLTNPIIVCEGIDFDDSYTWETIYELFNQQNMLEDMRAEGFDLVVLNFHMPLTYIQSNAYLFSKLVQMVNDTINFETEISIVGPSMGGMVTRYALTYMETNNIDHNCNLWISFEAPHQGANIPLGLQYGVFFFKDLDANVQMLLDVLDEPAPNQMLVYLYTDPPTSPAGHNLMFDTFQDELSALGNYPQSLRKIAISNGRGDAIGQPYIAGDQAVSLEYNSWLLDVLGNMWTVKDNASGLIFEGLMDPLIGSTDQLNVNVFSPKPYDNAPGGMRSTFAELGELELPFGELEILLDNHAYIPTISALDIDNENLFYNIATDPNIMNSTPFDSIYWSADNFDHIYISPETAALIISEIKALQKESQTVMLSSGWNDISSYINPAEKNIQDLAAQFGGDLIIMQHFGEVYWPEGGLNTLLQWDYKKGYLLKVEGDQEFNFTGSSPDESSINIREGWNLIPVLCRECSSLIELLGEDVDKVKIIREGIGFNMFWPEAGISTLSHFIPGNSYYLYADEAFVLNFGH